MALSFLSTALTTDGGLGPYWPLWIVAAGITSVSWPIAMGTMQWLVRSLDWPLSVALPAAWIGGEWLRREAFFLLDGNGFPFLQLGHSQIDALIVPQIADLSGVLLVSALLAMVNGFVVDALSAMTTRKPGARPLWYSGLLSATVVGVALVYGWVQASHSSTQGPTVLLAPRSLVGSDDFWRDLTGQIPQAVNLVVLPEMSFTRTIVDGSSRPEESPHNDRPGMASAPLEFEHSNDLALIQQHADMLRRSVVVGCFHVVHDRDDWRIYNAVAFFDHDRGYQGCYDKLHLAMGADFLPYWLELSALIPAELSMTPTCNRTGSWERPMGFDRGQRCPIFTLHTADQHYRFGCAVCYDAAFATPFHQYCSVEQNADFFVISGFEGADSSGMAQQVMLNFARFRAIEFRRPIARCAQGGISCIINSAGAIVPNESAHPLPADLHLGVVPLDGRSSVYARLGDFPLLAAFLIAVGASCCKQRRRAKKQRHRCQPA
jgi:apolipoprotein N-acyltransferase